MENTRWHQQLVQIKWNVAVNARDPYLVKQTPGLLKKLQRLNRAEEIVIIRHRIGHKKATKYHIVFRGPPTVCHHCGQTLAIDLSVQEYCDEYCTVDSLNTHFETFPRDLHTGIPARSDILLSDII